MAACATRAMRAFLLAAVLSFMMPFPACSTGGSANWRETTASAETETTGWKSPAAHRLVDDLVGLGDERLEGLGIAALRRRGSHHLGRQISDVSEPAAERGRRSVPATVSTPMPGPS